MRHSLIANLHASLFLPVAALIACAPDLAVAQDDYAQNNYQVEASLPADVQKFSSEELRNLLAPVALYPDSLLAQILPAAAYPTQIVEAYRHTQTSPNPSTPPAEATWDSSVIALLHFPPVLKKMNDDLQWTEQLGVAATYQMTDVQQMIQQLRAEARAAGNLQTTDQQRVVVDRNIIEIVPANPQVIYVPDYDPYYIGRPWGYGPFLSFGVGFGTGLWLGGYFDWHRHHIYHHHYWRRGRWYPWSASRRWAAPYRSVPSWYRRGGSRVGFADRSPRTGFTSGRNRVRPLTPRSTTAANTRLPASRTTTPARTTPGAAGTTPNTATSPRTATPRTRENARSFSQGVDSDLNRLQARRNAERGQVSRQITRPQTVQRAPGVQRTPSVQRTPNVQRAPSVQRVPSVQRTPSVAPRVTQPSWQSFSDGFRSPRAGAAVRQESSRGAISRGGANRGSGGGGGGGHDRGDRRR